jgi:hypothetical protein
MFTTRFPIVPTQAIEMMLGKKGLKKVELPGKDFLKTDDVESLTL